MLYIVAFINNTAIDRVNIRNTEVVNSRGEHQYIAIPMGGSKSVKVWHKREYGWMRLTEKVLRKLNRKGKINEDSRRWGQKSH